jgi:hypothetical protein
MKTVLKRHMEQLFLCVYVFVCQKWYYVPLEKYKLLIMNHEAFVMLCIWFVTQ